MSKVHYGYGSLRIGDGERRTAPNFDGGSDFLDGIIQSLITNGSRNFQSEARSGCSWLFLRPSSLRYTKDQFINNIVSVHSSGNEFKQWYENIDGASTYYRYTRARQQTVNETVDVDNDAFGREIATGAVVSGYSRLSFFQSEDGGQWPFSKYGEFPVVSWVDVPGMTIGNHFLHQPGEEQYFFVDTGDNPTSQGDITWGGHFLPPENMLNHYVYDVYITASGGTGTIDGGVGSQTNGSMTSATGPSSEDEFIDGDAGGHFVGVDDGNHYIAIRSATRNGTYKILGITDTNTVRIDSIDINEPCAGGGEGPFDWTLREGPIAEYFWRRRPYNKYDRPHTGMRIEYQSINFYAHSHEVLDRDGANAPVLRSVNDGYGIWWSLSPVRDAANLDAYNLVRYVQMSPRGFDPVYADGDITDMPTGIEYWRDLDVDDNKILWVAWDQSQKSPDAPDADKTLARIDPAPGGATVNPAVTSAGADLYEAQSGLADATGLCSNKPAGVLCDHVNDVTYIFHDTGTRLATDQDNGGISYTPDGGTTWKRLHRLHTIAGTVTVANGSPSVTAGTALDTNFAAGDWVRFGADTRSYEIQSVDTAATMTLAENYAGTETTGAATQKGALSSDQAVVYTDYSVGTGLGFAGFNRAQITFDKDGNIYWIPSAADRVCKFKWADGRVYDVLTSEMPTDGAAISQVKRLAVSRVPQFTGHPVHEFDNDVWVGSHAQGMVRIPFANFENPPTTPVAPTVYADSGTEPGVKTTVTSTAHGLLEDSRIEITGTTAAEYDGFHIATNVTANTFDIGVVFGSDPAAKGTWETYFTKYHWSVATSWPTVVDIGSTVLQYQWTPFFDETSGAIYLMSGRRQSDWAKDIHTILADEPNIGTTDYGSTVHFPGANNAVFAGSTPGQLTEGFGRWGTSQGFMAAPGFDDLYNEVGATLHHGHWTLYGWTGSAWEVMQGNNHLADLDFDASDGAPGPGPYVAFPSTFAVGLGSRRAMEVAVDTENGMNILFTQNGAVSQVNEYVIDEHTTIPCYVGWGKDNISDAEYALETYFSPTVFRDGDNPVTSVENMWTKAGSTPATVGIDGGWMDNVSPASTPPNFARGPAEPAVLAPNGDGSYYENWVSGTGSQAAHHPDHQMMAVIRIKPELERSGDYNVTISDNTFTSETGGTFVAGDVGKIITIENSQVGTFDNNGDYLITGFTNGTTVTVDRNFPATETDTEDGGGVRRWKLTDVPPVGFVEVTYEYALYGHEVPLDNNFVLYNSPDRGASWVQQKQSLASAVGTAENEDIANFEDAGVIISTASVYNYEHALRVMFDITDLSDLERRRTYWKIYREYGTRSGELRPACIALRDANLGVICATENKHVDADDSLWVAHKSTVAHLVLFDDGVPLNIKATDDGDGDNYTNLLTLQSGTFYEATGTNGDTTVGANKFEDTVASSFVPEDVGKVLRIAAATPEGGGDYFGFVTITAVDSADRVTIDVDLTNTTGLAWELLTFGYGDTVYFDEDYLLPTEYITARALRPTILDVPTSTTITLQSASVPLTASTPFIDGAAFQITRPFPDGVGRLRLGRSGQTPVTPDPEAGYGMTTDPRYGVWFYTDPLEFFELKAGVGSCTTAADTDGDGRVQSIKIVGADWTATGGFGEVAAGDLLLVDGTYGRRYYEVATVTLNGADTDITVTMDELPPSGTFTVTALRRMWWKARVLESEVISQETMP